MKSLALRLGAVLALALLVSGCVTTKSVMKNSESFQVTQVTVKNAPGVSGSLRGKEELRVQTQNRAYQVSETGRPYHLEIELLRVHLANGIGPKDSTMVARIEVYDAESGKPETAFDSFAIVGHGGGLIGAIVNSFNDQVADEQKLSAFIADDIMRKLYGSEFLEKAPARTAKQQATATYPVSIEDANQHLTCEVMVATRNRRSSSTEHVVSKLPEACLALGYKLQSS